MRYAQMREMDISNGTGIGVALFVQGCPLRCKGCFNPSTWDFDGGREWSQEIKKTFFSLIDKPYITRVSILGGEPLAEKNIDDVLDLIRDVKHAFPDKSIWLYTGYTVVWQDILLLRMCDVIVDGAYEQEKRDITLPFRGSSNQRIIDVKETVRCGRVQLLDERTGL